MNRSETYMARIVLEALDKEVYLDADVVMHKEGKKIKAYCPQTQTYLQFPREIRKKYKRLVADIVKSANASGTPFFRAFKGSIRENKDSEVLL